MGVVFHFTSFTGMAQGPMKVYVHYEDVTMEYTSIVRCQPQDPLASLCQIFIQSIQSAFPSLHIDPTQYELRNERGKVLSIDWTVAKCHLASGDDLFVVPAPTAKPTAQALKKKAKISADDRHTANMLKDEGNERMKRGEFASAVEYYSDALLLTPDNAVLYGNRAQAYLNLERYEQALEDACMCTQLDSTFAKGYLRAGKAAVALKRPGVAHGHFVRGLRVTDSKNDKLSKTMSREFRKLIQESELAIQEERAAARSAPVPEDNTAVAQPAPTASPSLSAEQKEQVIEELQRSLETMRDHFSAGQLRKAKAVCEEVLQVVKGEKLTTHYLSTILIAAEKYHEALRVLQPAVEVHPKELELRLSLGEAYYQTGNYQKAYSTLSAAQKLAQTPADSDRAAIRRARCLLKLKRESEASAIISELLQKNQNNTEALVEYGTILMERGIQQEAIKVFLRSLILNSEDKTIRRKLALAARAPGGLDALLKELQDANSASALGFLALIFKDYGALEESATLFKGAATEAPASATYTLNYVHVLEILTRYSESYTFIRTFLHHNAEVSLPHSDGQGQLTCAAVMEVIENTTDIDALVRHRTEEAAEERVSLPESYLASEEKKAHGFSADQLDLLALLFTLVKILFLQGQLKLAQQLIELIEPVRTKKELHLTSIRNEHAYYCCVAQLLPHLKFPLASSPPLYVVGDSHTLPVAWQELTTSSGEKRFTIPKLVTGCKMWHLRPESFFFTKDNFYNMVESIPDGATAVFLFGEIDCREGILVAVEKCRYDSVQEGIDHTIDIFMQVLTEIKQKKNLNILVHPVVPVLNETRAMVKQFNTALKERVTSSPELQWLEFYENLLTEDKEQLREEYSLDGTHLHPAYLALLEKAL